MPASTSALRAPASTRMTPLPRAAAASHPLRAESRSASRAKTVPTRSPASSARSAPGRTAGEERRRDALGGEPAGGLHLGDHAADAALRPGATGRPLDLAGDAGHVVQQGRARLGGAPVVEPVHVGEHRDEVRLDAAGDEAGQGVVVAHLDLVHRDGVVLVHHRDDAEVEEPLERAPRVEEAGARGEVVGGEEHLRDGAAVRAERRAPGRHEVRLSDGRGGLLRRDVPGAAAPPHERELLGAEPHRARGDEDEPAAARELRELLAEPGAVLAVEPALAVDDRAGPDLHDDPLRAGEGRPRHGGHSASRTRAAQGRR